LLAAPGLASDALPGVNSADEQIVKGAKLASDGPALVDYLRRLDIPRGDGPNDAVTTAVVRLIARKKPDGAAGVLLGYAAAGAGSLAEEVDTALAAVAFRDGKPDPLLVDALNDKSPGRRMRAALALCQAQKSNPLPEVTRLLKDPDLAVRVHVARALLDMGMADAVPILIALVTELPADQAWQADEALRRMAGVRAPTVTLGSDDSTRRQCRDSWGKWWQENDGPTLLELFRRWTPQNLNLDEIHVLIRQLGDDDYDVREKATASLIQKGGAALAFLREAAKDADLEVVDRARTCIRDIEKGLATVVPAAAARVLALRKPPGAAEALLAYLPIADEGGAEEIQEALSLVGLPDGKPDQALLNALQDKVPARRALAAVILSQAGPSWQRDVRRLLGDSDPTVRLRVALALADQRDREAIPVLVAVLNDLSETKVWQAEEVLRNLAGEHAPAVPLGTDGPSRQKCHDAWQAWWRAHANEVDLARLEGRPRVLGYTLVAEWTEGRNGRVLEVGPSNSRTRWEVDKIPWALDAELLPGNRLLLPEFYERRITERNFKGDVLWEKRLDQTPLAVKRLANGNTFIATTDQLIEVDRSGKEVSGHTQSNLLAARKLPDGRVACINSAGRYLLLDANGKELKSFAVGSFHNYCGFDVLPGGRLLVPLTNANEVVEFDATGQVVWKTTVEHPSSAERLGNGHTLVASRDTQLVVELDRTGKVVWQFKPGGYAWRAHRR
jgi:HEAT repeat protein